MEDSGRRTLGPMILARVPSVVGDVLLVLHILAVIVAFAPSVSHPLTGGRLLREDAAAGRKFFSVAAGNNRTVYTPALVAVGVLGFGLIGVSDGAYQFSEPWISAAILLWVVIAGIVGAVIIPGEREIAAGDTNAQSKVTAAGGVLALLLVIVIFLMVVKPG